jgi:hypothetical protein
MFASRNLLALKRAKDAEREVCSRVGREREEVSSRGGVVWYWYQLHQQQLLPLGRLLLLPCRAFKVSSSMPRKQSGTYISLACTATLRRICAHMEEAINKKRNEEENK